MVWEWPLTSYETQLIQYGERLTPRQWRLFACACVRRVETAARGSSGESVALAERFADGNATAHQLASARFGGRFLSGNAAWAVCWDPKEDARTMAERAAAWAAGLRGEGPKWEERKDRPDRFVPSEGVGRDRPL